MEDGGVEGLELNWVTDGSHLVSQASALYMLFKGTLPFAKKVFKTGNN